MKTKLISMTWLGSASVDPRFSASMLRWSVADIRNRGNSQRLSVGIESGGVLEAYDTDFELRFRHQLKYIVGMCRMTRKPENGRHRSSSSSSAAEMDVIVHAKGDFMEVYGLNHGLIYLLKDPRDPLLHIHLFESEAVEEMAELMHQMRDPSQTLGGSVGSIPQSIVAASGSNGGGGGHHHGGSNGNGNDKSSTLQQALGGQGIHSTPASNLKVAEAMRLAKHDGGPSIFSPKMAASKSYTSGLSHSAGAVTTSNGNLSLFGDISPNHSHFFEVMYVGKIKVSHKRVPETFIDDALPKFRAYDAQRVARLKEQAARRNSSAFEASEAATSTGSTTRLNAEEMRKVHSGGELKTVNGKDGEHENEEEGEEITTFKDKVLGTSKLQEENKGASAATSKKPEFLRMQSQIALPVVSKSDGAKFQTPAPPPERRKRPEEIPFQRDRSASIGTIPDQNRTMVFLLGLSDIRLISPDRKQVLLYKDFKDIASCAQGHTNSDHFGIICRETHNDGFIAYVFKCQSDTVADDIVQAISLAFVTCSEQKLKEKAQVLSCDQCPMLWYHKLCSDVEGLNERKTQSVILKRIETLGEDEQESIMAKFQGAEEVSQHTLVQQVQFLMMLLRAHCESRQQRHVHDTAENRSEFLNHYLGGSTILMKAKRSLSNSFDHLLKRKSIKDEMVGPVKEFQRAFEEQQQQHQEGGSRSKHNLSISPSRPPVEPIKSPMMDIFMKVGNNPRDRDSDRTGSWRQNMLHKVATPSKSQIHAAAGSSVVSDQVQLLSPYRGKRRNVPAVKRTKEDWRELWQTAIRQTILLARMERENACLQKRQNENEIKKIKLEYDEILQCDKQAVDLWEGLIEKEGGGGGRVLKRCDREGLLQAIKGGVPRSKRGDVWLFLVEQAGEVETTAVDVAAFPNYNVPYETLLKSLTEHQHAIFIDLGRTFPNHNYYKQPLGLGQLSLFNLLKAYSILDPELGYCQGLGFICGVLLLHSDEAHAFELLKHLMFRRQMRTKYLPDMKQFQLQLYQLSRLLKDTIPELYEWLDQNDISPTLYAAPWILTAFSSQFPLGFVARVFDLMFLESADVIFRVSLALLEHHKAALMARNNFEEIMDYLKNAVPNIDADTVAAVMRRTFTLDVSRQLVEYQVEYNVLQEEMTSQRDHAETLNRATEQNRQLETQLQIAHASIAQLEKTRFTQQNQIQSLQSQVQSMEVTVETIGEFINRLIDTRHDLEFPGEIRRIAQQIQNAEQRKRGSGGPFVERKISKSLSMTSHLGSMLRVLEEGNEEQQQQQSPKAMGKKLPFFENTFEQMRHQKSVMRLNTTEGRLQTTPTINSGPEVAVLVAAAEEEREMGQRTPCEIDSGIATPLSPPQLSPAAIGKRRGSEGANQRENVKENVEEEGERKDMGMTHPLSECNGVSFRFSGTTPLKSMNRLSGGGSLKLSPSPPPTGGIPRQLQEIEKNGRA